MDFVSRIEETLRLKTALQREQHQLIILMGRRRTGKSRLIREVLRPDDIYMLADQSDVSLQRSYMAAVVEQQIPGFSSVVYPTWDSLLRQLNRMVTKGAVVCLDEFPYLVKSAPELPSVIQRLCDNRGDLNFHLLLCGSSQQMMSRLVHDQTAPLFGRADEMMRLRPMQISALREYLQVDGVGAVNEFAVWGGIPRYWEIRKQHLTLDDAISSAVLNPLGVLHEEPARLFLDDLRTSIQADSLLQVIGNGCHRLSEIAGRLQKPATQLNQPLSLLIELGFVKRDMPYGESTKSTKRTLYRISDPFLRFYFRYVAPNRSMLALHSPDSILRQIQPGLTAFVAAEWEQICRESINRILPNLNWLPAQSWWGPDRNGKPLELDVVSETADKQLVMLGECQWADEVSPHAILSDLKEKAARLAWLDNRPIQYVLFTKNPHPGPAELRNFTANDVTDYREA
jgi:AAA+ ATPase superfamily predicted ATPase